MDDSRNTRKMRNPHEDEEEKAHFQRIVSAFKYYRTHSLQRVAKTESYLRSLPTHHQKLLDNYRRNLTEIRSCIENNDQIIKLIIKDVANMFENVNPTSPLEPVKLVGSRPSPGDLEKVQATLKQFVRDWSEEGAPERQTCYQPIVEEVVSHFPTDMSTPQDVKVLVPGAGLGRLAFEIARRGYTCQGNEFSLFMLFTSNFVLNKCRGTNVYQVYPWVHQYVNNLRPEHQTQGVSFPDINPADLPQNAQFSMAAGDFLEVYTEKDEWDCVSTCFFIDCANNIVAFIETIFNILKPDLANENSIEPSYQVVREVIIGIGFEIEKYKERKRKIKAYSYNKDSVIQHLKVYNMNIMNLTIVHDNINHVAAMITILED
ncbi:Carnosine N-methyltransferase [Blattella germanica]|nr:Carnosine N-methyltransferase [Blattella germanica]